MRFQILSHAGLLVAGQSKTLISDPWIIGSTYWRSWWNYPPVSPELIRQLRPDYIYLTHIHWDHFHGPSLRKFSPDTPIIVPRGHFGRVKRDLVEMGCKNVVELRHGESFDIEPGFRIYSYQFAAPPDSCLVVECDGVTLLNANDSKFMGPPLRHILRRHPKVDFVFRSHSSANSRICYEVEGEADAGVDDLSAYTRSFAAFAVKSGARYAVPFASNHCYLHKDTFHFNEIVKTPWMVKQHFEEQNIRSPEVVVMLSGDSWSPETGFDIQPSGRRYFEERDRLLEEYRESQKEKLEAFYAREARTTVRLKDMEKYFQGFFAAMPFFVRRFYRGHPIRYHLHAGERVFVFEIDLARRTVREVAGDAPLAPMPELHTSALAMRHAMAFKFCGQMFISKRVRFRVTPATKKYMRLFTFLLSLYEYEYLPFRCMFRYRFLENWALRWREVLLYVGMASDRLRRRPFSEEQYILATRT